MSATLENPDRFFSELTGLWPQAIQTIEPVSGDLEHIGHEYMLALRGDPVSKTSLLSTTLQTLMLIRRCMGHSKDKDPSGNRVFAFCDKLDVIWRLHDNLVDAEDTKGLSGYRSEEDGEDPYKFQRGQAWRLCEAMNFELGDPLNLPVAPVTAQTSDGKKNQDIIIATASLEVGYDDDEVGTVVQHKAPLDMASFLQRKGRAGRKVGMRPWTIVTLADFGNDRTAFLNYEQLFAPKLSGRSLPMANEAVIRMQAVYATLDWLGTQVKGQNKKDYWALFSRHRPKPEQNAQRKALEVLDKILAAPGDKLSQDFKMKIAYKLGLQDNEGLMDRICWHPPRSLFGDVLPTLRRKLHVWLDPELTERQKEFENTEHPLPQFVAGNLFDPISEGSTNIRAHGRNQTMPRLKALKEFCPGRATKQLSFETGSNALWLPIPLDQTSSDKYVLEPRSWKPIARIGHHELGKVTVYEPTCLDLYSVPTVLSETSNARWSWNTSIFAPHGGIAITHAEDTRIEHLKPWDQLFTEVQTHLYADLNEAEVTRFSTQSTASIRWSNGNSEDRTTFVYDETGQPAAVGTQLHVDAVSFRLNIPERLHRLQSKGAQQTEQAFEAASISPRGGQQ